MSRTKPTREERIAANRLEQHLLKSHHEVEFRPGHDPPDWVFAVDGRRWAVEVTGLVPKLLHKGKSISRRGVDARSRSIEKRVQEEAMQRSHGSATGLFWIQLAAPFTRAEVDTIVDRSAKFIVSGQEGERDTLDDGSAVVSFRGKAGTLEVGSAYGIRPFSKLADDKGSDAYNLTAAMSQTVQDMLASKMATLEQIVGYDEVVLALWTDTGFRQRELLSRALAEHLPATHSIDRIFYLNSLGLVPYDVWQVYPNLGV